MTSTSPTYSKEFQKISFEKVTQKLSGESESMKKMLSYFSCTEVALNFLNTTLTKSLHSLHDEISKRPSLDTISISILTLTKELTQFNQRVNQQKTTLHNDISEPLELFLDHYDNTNRRFCRELSMLSSSIKNSKQKAKESKQTYFSLSKSVDVKERILADVVLAVDRGEMTTDLLDQKTSK
jgi:hypothetical protein